MLDFSNAEDQKEYAAGPVPAGSIVMVEMKVLLPHETRQSPENKYYSCASSGLRQVYCEFEVVHGSYQGVRFRQNITLPHSEQMVELTEGQYRACGIGASQLKAICMAARKPPKCNDITSMSGLRFPAKLKINNRPSQTADGRVFWNNELSLVITPDKEQYAAVCNGGEVITDGPVTGDVNALPQQNTAKVPSAGDYETKPFPSENVDQIPW